MKHPLQSKSYWIFLLVAVARLVIPSFKEWYLENPEVDTILNLLIGLSLRTISKDKIVFKKQGMELPTIIGIVLIPLIVSCSSADLVIRNDPNIAPIDANYLTMAFETECEGKKLVTFGQAGCWMAFESELSNQTVSVMAPLRSSITIKSKATGYHKSFMMEPGKKLTLNLEEMIAPQTEHAVFSFATKWEKPEEIKTEVPVKGQEGIFYFRLGPKGSSPAGLEWTPSGSATSATMPGMAYSQFSGDGKASDEPILLAIKTTKSVGLGRFQIYSEAKQIGIKNTEFSGDEILVRSDAILSPQKMDFYTLAGWARTQNLATLLELDNDFIVGVSLYDPHIKKLAADISFTEKQVCFKTENVVSLVALSSIEKASNKIEDCFDRPTGQAHMFFFTNIGRAAMAEIDGVNGTYILHQ